MKCRSCSNKTENILDFGQQYLAGNFFDNRADSINAIKYPLRLNICNSCSLLQIEEVPEINLIFNKNYSYLTGKIPDLVNHFKGYSEWIKKNFLNLVRYWNLDVMTERY